MMLAGQRRQQRSGAIAIPSDATGGRLRRFLRRFTSAPSHLLSEMRRRSMARWQSELGSLQLELAASAGRRRQRTASLSWMATRTDFSRDELKIIYRRFKDECPYGQMQEESLHRILAQVFPLGNAHPFAHFVFCCFDTSRSGTVGFEQFALSLNTLLRGSREERLRWIFCMYDINRDGEISRRELSEIVSSIFELLGPRVWPPATPAAVQHRADDAFRDMDVDGDGQVSWEDFRRFCCSRPDVLAGIDSLQTLIL